MGDEFGSKFHQLTSNPPLSWQKRLYQQWIDGDIKSVIDLPTGLGKTMVMAIWLIAREKNPNLGRRLIYVVDRRTVVDQASDIAQMLIARPMTKWMYEALKGEPPAISTLRGQLADNREWSRDPSKPAIIIGTVDLIGSALLFSGYRSSYKRRPLEAGLLGQDSLLVLDEAHLSKPFEKLLKSIEQFNLRGTGVSPVKPLRIIRMSATSSGDEMEPFKLEKSDRSDPIIEERFTANKKLSIETLGEKDKFNDKLADAAIKLATIEDIKGKRIVVFVRRPDDARAIAERIRKNKEYADSVEILTGTMRGLERDELVKKPVFTDRWLNGDLKPDDPENQAPVFLISTSAGEVGFDLNADHMVCDATTIDSLIQRLGRVNRRGKGEATIQLFVEEPKKEKDGKPKKVEGLERAIANTVELLGGVNDVSPKNIAALKESERWKEIVEGQQKSQYELACSPEPATVELTDILVDAWSMTSITERMPGRPDVAPWLRGTAEEQAQTTIAWRAELELFGESPEPVKALTAIFTKHPIRSHESLTVNTRYLIEEFLKKLGKLKDRPENLLSTRVAVRLPRGKVVCRSIEQLVDDPGILYADSTLILPSRFGGLEKGLLNIEGVPKSRKPDEPLPDSLDVADHEGYEQRRDARPRLRFLIERDANGSWKAIPLPGGNTILVDVMLQPTYDKSTQLFNDMKAADLRVRLVQAVTFDDEGDAVRSLVMLAPVGDKTKKEDQTLTEHVGLVEASALRIANELKLPDIDPIRVALLFAAKWHDEGKKAAIWQRFANNPDPIAVPLGKMAASRDPKSLKAYRHEFGSLLRIHHPDRHNTTSCELPADKVARDLALHLIATHHGGSRPHFDAPIDRDFAEGQCDLIHTDSIRRFARLQRTYGHWHLAWLESLLRCADAMASADPEAEIDDSGTEGGDQ